MRRFSWLPTAHGAFARVSAAVATLASLATLVALASAAAGCGRARDVEASAIPAEGHTERQTGEVVLGEQAQRAAHVVTARPRADLRHTVLTIAGTIDFAPDRVARVGPLVAGRIVRVKAQPGQAVKLGDELATLTSVEAGQASANLAAARARASRAETELARQELLMKSNATSESALLGAQTERTLAANEVARASTELTALGASGTSTTISLKAPIDGDVLAADVRVGQTVSASDVLFVVGRTDEVWLSFDVYERDLPRVHLGDAARVSVLAYPERSFTGKVDHLGLLVDPLRRAVSARVVLANPDGLLKPGLSASARILGTPTGDTVMVVPRAALQTFDGSPLVFVQRSPGTYDARAVERGADLGEEIEIVRGVSADELVVVGGAFVLKSELLRDQMGKND